MGVSDPCVRGLIAIHELLKDAQADLATYRNEPALREVCRAVVKAAEGLRTTLETGHLRFCLGRL